MTSPPLASTHGRTTSGVTWYHHLWAAQMVKRRRLWHYITAFVNQRRSNDVECGMTSPPLASTHGRTTSGVAWHYRLWAARTIKRRRVWHDITAFVQHTRSNDIERGILLSPLGSTQGRTTSGLACHHRLWAAHTVRLRRAWHDITALGQHTWSDNVGRGMTSPPLDSTYGRTTSGQA